MKKVLIVLLSDNLLYIYPENVKILKRGDFMGHSMSPCIRPTTHTAWSGYGAIMSSVNKPAWFKPPYTWCYMTTGGKLI